MFANAIRTLYHYTTWANGRLFDAAANVAPNDILAPDPGAFGSLRDTLVHILYGQWLWNERWQGRSPRVTLDPNDFPDLAAIRARWQEIDAATHRLLAGWTGDDLATVVPYVNPRGETWSYPRWQEAFDQVNHATQHRSEAAARLTRLGHSPGELDFLHYLDAVNAGAA